MASATPDLAQGHELNEILGQVDIERVWIVSGLVGAPEAQLLEAVRDPAVPKLGEGYPGEPQWFVVNIRAVPDNAPNTVRIFYTYSNRQGPTWNQTPPATDGQDVKQFNGMFTKIKVINDRAASPMTIAPPASFPASFTYISEAEIDLPTGLLTFEQSRSTHPAAFWRSHGRTVNNAIVGPYARNSLLLWNLQGQSTDGGRVWQTTWQFAYDPLLHKHTDRFHGPDGKVPQGAADASFDIYPETNFSLLPVDFDDAQTPI